MSKNIKYFFYILFILIILTSCQPSVRFSIQDNTSSFKDEDKDKHVRNGSNKKLEQENGKNIDFIGNLIIKEAEKWLGTPYCSGGETRDCIDCSGFTMNVYENVGINLPRSAAEQYDYSIKLNEKDCVAGDLVFFGVGNKISHVGIYAGNKEFIHSSSSKGVVRQSLSDSYYSKKFMGYCRVINIVEKFNN